MVEYEEYEIFEKFILSCFIDGEWGKILNLNINSCSKSARKLMWSWPTEEDLLFIGALVSKKDLTGIISIGCGNGLFEWLLGKCTNINVRGIEVNETWWKSKYSGPKFISLNFPRISPEKQNNILNKKEALLFCYFNDENAFRDYVAAYQGNLIVIIGPKRGTNIYASPDPIQPDFGTAKGWTLFNSKFFKNGIDVAYAYTRIQF